MNYTIEEFLPPLRQTAMLCSMDLQPPVHSSGMTFIPGVNTDAERATVEARAHDHVDRLIAALRALGARKAA